MPLVALPAVFAIHRPTASITQRPVMGDSLAVTVTPDTATASEAEKARGRRVFTIRNSASVSEPVVLTAACEGVVIGCTVSPARDTLAAHDSAKVTVTYILGTAPATAVVGVDAGWGSRTHARGRYTITLVSAPAAAVSSR